MDAATIQEQITVAKALLTALGDALLALADPTISAYTFDTGQTVERVTRESLPDLYDRRQALQNEICTLEARLTGSGVTHGRPAW